MLVKLLVDNGEFIAGEIYRLLQGYWNMGKTQVQTYHLQDDEGNTTTVNSDDIVLFNPDQETYIG